MTGLLAHGVRLALVLCHALVDILNDIGTDGGREDSGDGVGGLGGLAIGTHDRDGRSGGHCVLPVFFACLSVVEASRKIRREFQHNKSQELQGLD